VTDVARPYHQPQRAAVTPDLPKAYGPKSGQFGDLGRIDVPNHFAPRRRFGRVGTHLETDSMTAPSEQPTADVAITAGPESTGDTFALANGPLLVGRAVDSAVGSTGATVTQVKQALGLTSQAYTGAGIEVGVLSDSFNDLGGAAQDELSGALPPASRIKVIRDLASGGSDEGHAMLQIVHDIAPDANLALHRNPSRRGPGNEPSAGGIRTHLRPGSQRETGPSALSAPHQPHHLRPPQH
jgi:hypothetical protein